MKNFAPGPPLGPGTLGAKILFLNKGQENQENQKILNNEPYQEISTFISFLHVNFAKIAADVRFLIKCVENYNALLQNTHRFPCTVCLFIAVFALFTQICV